MNVSSTGLAQGIVLAVIVQKAVRENIIRCNAGLHTVRHRRLGVCVPVICISVIWVRKDAFGVAESKSQREHKVTLLFPMEMYFPCVFFVVCALTAPLGIVFHIPVIKSTWEIGNITRV
jgi:hypothetical protein